MFKVRSSFRFVFALALVALAIDLTGPHFTQLAAQNQGANGGNYSDTGAPVFGNSTTAAPGTGTNTILAAPAAGVRNYLYQASCITTGATVIVGVIKEGSTIKAYIPCNINGAGATQPVRFDPPIPFAAATAVTASASPAAAGSVQFFAAGRTAR